MHGELLQSEATSSLLTDSTFAILAGRATGRQSYESLLASVSEADEVHNQNTRLLAIRFIHTHIPNATTIVEKILPDGEITRVRPAELAESLLELSPCDHSAAEQNESAEGTVSALFASQQERLDKLFRAFVVLARKLVMNLSAGNVRLDAILSRFTPNNVLLRQGLYLCPCVERTDTNVRFAVPAFGTRYPDNAVRNADGNSTADSRHLEFLVFFSTGTQRAECFCRGSAVL